MELAQAKAECLFSVIIHNYMSWQTLARSRQTGGQKYFVVLCVKMKNIPSVRASNYYCLYEGIQLVSRAQYWWSPLTEPSNIFVRNFKYFGLNTTIVSTQNSETHDTT